jgi:hypothetical protein
VASGFRAVTVEPSTKAIRVEKADDKEDKKDGSLWFTGR